ncbi:hypothetical protein Tco_1340295 [Tanacetum coccineum]
MKESLPTMVDDRVKEITKTQVLVYVAQGLIIERQQNQTEDDPHGDAHPKGENSVKRQKNFKHGTFKFGESSSGQDFKSEQGDEHQYHIDQMQNFLKNNIIWESRIEILVSPHPQRPTLKGSSGPEKIVMSLHKFPAVIFSDDDIDKTTSRWLGVESYQQKVNLTAPTISFPGIENYKVFSIVFEPVYGIIYKNDKKEKRVMIHQEVYKFCDATLKRVLEGLKSYNNDVKHRYVTPSLSNKDVEYLQLFEEEIEERLKHRDQMRHWEMYMNGRPLGSRRERLK